jgi:hypothetical protein
VYGVLLSVIGAIPICGCPCCANAATVTIDKQVATEDETFHVLTNMLAPIKGEAGLETRQMRKS